MVPSPEKTAQGLSTSSVNNSVHARRLCDHRSMSDEWLLSLADVAEALRCTRDEVTVLIARRDLATIPGRHPRVAHTELVRFVAEAQRAALALGQDPIFEPSLIALRPAVFLDDDRPDRS